MEVLERISCSTKQNDLQNATFMQTAKKKCKVIQTSGVIHKREFNVFLAIGDKNVRGG